MLFKSQKEAILTFPNTHQCCLMCLLVHIHWQKSMFHYKSIAAVMLLVLSYQTVIILWLWYELLYELLYDNISTTAVFVPYLSIMLRVSSHHLIWSDFISSPLLYSPLLSSPLALLYVSSLQLMALSTCPTFCQLLVAVALFSHHFPLIPVGE